MNKIPLARSTDIVVQELDKEILVYDLLIHKAYSLNETTSIVYSACDGRTSFDELKRKQPKLTDEVILLALSELEGMNLLAEKIETEVGRRELLQKAAMSALTLPIIVGITAPTSAQSRSCLADEEPCNNVQECCGTQCFSLAPASPVCSGDVCTANGLPCTLGGQKCCGGGLCVPSGIPGLTWCSNQAGVCLDNGLPGCTTNDDCCDGHCAFSSASPGVGYCADPQICISTGNPCDAFHPNCCSGICFSIVSSGGICTDQSSN